MSQQGESDPTTMVISPDRILTPGRVIQSGVAMHEGMEHAARHMNGTGFWCKGRRGNPHEGDLELAQAWDAGYEQFETMMLAATQISGDGQILSGPMAR